MKREIKFRAWFPTNEEMLYSDMLHVSGLDGLIGASFQPAIKGYLLRPLFKPETKQPVLMQFTGLKDKNGKEIYEGDIVQWENYSKEKENIEVEWDDLGEWFPFGGNDEALSGGIVQVVGNIYENPELLNK